MNRQEFAKNIIKDILLNKIKNIKNPSLEDEEYIDLIKTFDKEELVEQGDIFLLSVENSIRLAMNNKEDIGIPKLGHFKINPGRIVALEAAKKLADSGMTKKEIEDIYQPLARETAIRMSKQEVLLVSFPKRNKK